MLTEMMNVVLEVDYRRINQLPLHDIGDMLENFAVVINDATPEWRMQTPLEGTEGDHSEL